MGNITKAVDGVVVTDTDVPPPRDWINVYEEIGGDMQWNEDVEKTFKDDRGLVGDVQPFFGTCSYTGEVRFLMQIGGGDFFFWNALENSMFRIHGNLTLQEIVDRFDEEGIDGFDLEYVREGGYKTHRAVNKVVHGTQ